MNHDPGGTDTPERFVNAEWLEPSTAQALALRYTLDDLLPAQSLILGATARAVVLDMETGFDPELTVLEYSALSGWRGATVYLPTNTRDGLAAAAAWLLAHRGPLEG